MMDLNRVREDINKIDDEMKTLFNERLKCSDEVAKIKMETDDQVYKPQREKEMASRLSADLKYLCLNKKIVQISRKHQYEIFIDNKKQNKNFMDSFDAATKKVFQEGGMLSLNLFADRMKDKGLSVQDILSIISDSTLEVVELGVSQYRVNVTFKVENDEASKREALILSYMLYMETIKG